MQLAVHAFHPPDSDTSTTQSNIASMRACNLISMIGCRGGRYAGQDVHAPIASALLRPTIVARYRVESLPALAILSDSSVAGIPSKFRDIENVFDKMKQGGLLRAQD